MLKNPTTPKRIARFNFRQRKKLHVGEFQELAFEITVKLHTPISEEAYDTCFWAFIEFIELHNLSFGGGGSGEEGEFNGVIALPSRGSVTEEDRTRVEAFLRAQPEVLSVQCRELKDAWYGWE